MIVYLFGLLIRDDMHLWLAPFTPGGKHTICGQFKDRHDKDMGKLRQSRYYLDLLALKSHNKY